MNKNEMYRNLISQTRSNIDEEEMTITHTVNTKDLDRYLTIILPKGADVKNYLKNSVVLWSHNLDPKTEKIPIGKCESLEITDDDIKATTKFNKNDPLAVKVFNAYKDGFLNAWSIGFIPKKYKRFDEENVEDLNKKYGLNVTTKQIEDAGYFGIYLVYKWELLEYSAVPVPGNPGALTKEREAEFKTELVNRGLVNSEEDVDVRGFIQDREAREEEGKKIAKEKSQRTSQSEVNEPSEERQESEENMEELRKQLEAVNKAVSEISQKVLTLEKALEENADVLEAVQKEAEGEKVNSEELEAKVKSLEKAIAEKEEEAEELRGFVSEVKEHLSIETIEDLRQIELNSVEEETKPTMGGWLKEIYKQK